MNMKNVYVLMPPLMCDNMNVRPVPEHVFIFETEEELAKQYYEWLEQNDELDEGESLEDIIGHVKTIEVVSDGLIDDVVDGEYFVDCGYSGDI